MKQFFDFFPVVIFVVVYFSTKDMILATKVLMVASAIQIAGLKLLKRPIEKLHWGTFAIVEIMGGLTIALNDPVFIKWKPTVINWSFALVFLGSQFIGRRNLVRTMVEGFMKQAPHLCLNLPENKWRPINISWVLFFLFLGGVNLFVVYHFDESTWVTYKMVGQTVLNMAFMIAQFVYLSRYINEVSPDSNSNSQG